MKNRINIAETLDGCPKDTKLYSPIFGDVYLEKIRPHLAVVVTTESNDKEEFLYDGRYGINGECVLFPSKDQRDWSKFQRPFKDGDIVVSEKGDIHLLRTSNSSYCAFREQWENKFDCTITTSIKVARLATEEEKQKLFKAIKDNGYKWNPESKTLEKLPKFKVGDEISKRNSISNSWIIYSVSSEYYGLKLPNGFEGIGVLPVSEQDEWELVPNKFDINTLKPFDKVLVRDNNAQKWTADLFSLFDKSLIYPYSCVGHYTNQCIPYKGNEHLLGTTNDCNDFYKTWEE